MVIIDNASPLHEHNYVMMPFYLKSCVSKLTVLGPNTMFIFVVMLVKALIS